MAAQKNQPGGARMTTRRQLAVLTGLALLSIAAPAAAQTFDDFPNRPIRIIVPQAAASGISSIKDLVARAKANPGGINYGSFGIGNMTHLMGVLLSLAADIKMTHVPYRGQTPAITDVVAGQIPLAFTTTAGVADLVETKKLDLIATFGEARDEQFPHTPTVVESGYPSVIVVGWSGLFAPAGVPPQVVNRIYSGMAKRSEERRVGKECRCGW